MNKVRLRRLIKQKDNVVLFDELAKSEINFTLQFDTKRAFVVRFEPYNKKKLRTLIMPKHQRGNELITDTYVSLDYGIFNAYIEYVDDYTNQQHIECVSSSKSFITFIDDLVDSLANDLYLLFV